MNTKTQLAELIRGIEAVVTNEGTMNIIEAKEDLDERIRQVDGMGGLAGLSGDELRWGRDVMDKAHEIVKLFTRFELAHFTAGTTATMLAYMASGQALKATSEKEFQNHPDTANLLLPGADSRLMPERRLVKWYLCTVAQTPALMFHQAIEEGLKCLIYNDRPAKRPGRKEGHKDGGHELGKLLQTLTKLNPRRVAEIETVHVQRFQGTPIWSVERGTVRDILRLNKGLYQDARYNSQVWDRAETSGEIRDPEELAMAAESVYVVVRDLYMTEHRECLDRLELGDLNSENSYLKPPTQPVHKAASDFDD